MIIKLSPAERTTVVAALIAWGERELAIKIVGESREPEDDGPEVTILGMPKPYSTHPGEIFREENHDYSTEGNGARDSKP